MIIFPAIDIKDGKCVRLRRGEMSTAHTVAEDYLETAKSFKASGAEWVHMVDLDGAVHGEKKNSEIFIRTAEESGLKVEVGGGIRTAEDIEFYLSRGIERVIIGSAALTNPSLVREAAKKYGTRIAVGIDARNGLVAAEGWLKTSSVGFIELAKAMEDAGVANIIYTDIARDGMLTGPNTEQLFLLNESVSCNIVASGGIKNIDDIKILAEGGLYGAICGKSIYSGSLSLSEAIEAGGEQI